MKFLHSLTGNESTIVTGYVLKNGMKEITDEEIEILNILIYDFTIKIK